MRLALIPALACAFEIASAAVGHIYTYDPYWQSRANVTSRPTTLSPVTARLVLAQRAGVQAYHGSDGLDQEAMDAINAFGAATPLFWEEPNLKKAFIYAAGGDDIAKSIPAQFASRHFLVSPAPSASTSRGFFIDLAKQSDPPALSSFSDEDTLTLLQDSRTLTNNGDTFYIAQDMADFEAIATRFMIKGTHSVTLMIMPPGQYAPTCAGMDQWGTYDIPGAQPLLRKRREPQEEPLSGGDETDSAFPVVQSTSMPVSSLADQTPLQGILPPCFTSISACESATRNCTSHGHCYKKFHDRDQRDGGVDCYTCGCTATISKNDQGQVKTTNWGGPACQKRDVSIAFWLIALFLVGMVFLVSFAIGTIWSMGNEELPSVIGAGVSGPVKK